MDYAIRIRLLRPGNPTGGSGTHRIWPDAELAIAARMIRLADLGLTTWVAATIARRSPADADLVADKLAEYAA